MGVRLDPSDEYMHELGPEPNFNESMYINCFDHDQLVGGWFRIGNRANEGYAEMTVCLYLPDGRVAFTFKRPNITDNDAFDAGGMQWTIVKPFEELRVDYAGGVIVLDDPTAMVNPTRRTRHRARSSPRATTSSWSRPPAPSWSATRPGTSAARACATTRGDRATGRRSTRIAG